MPQQLRPIARAFIGAFIIVFLSGIILNAGLKNETINRFAVLIGGEFLSGGYIQFLTFFAFLLAFELIKIKRNYLNVQKSLTHKTVIPTKDKAVFLSEDVNQIRVKTEDSPFKESIVNKVIVRACAKFRGTNSTSEMINMVSEQMQVYSDHEYVETAPIRYLISSIPSLGFIGTIIGLSGAMKWAPTGNMAVITQELGVAFDTTLVALVLGLIINWYYSLMEKESDALFIEIKQYITDKLINKIEVNSQ